MRSRAKLSLNLLMRVDASTSIGTGHVMRCFALAQALKLRGGQATFVSAEMSPHLIPRLASEEFRLIKIKSTIGSMEDAIETSELGKLLQVDYVVVDGYAFGSSYTEKLREFNRVLLISDFAPNGPISADVILNQNFYAQGEAYRDVPSDVTFLFGPRFMLLRGEFWRWQNWRRQHLPIARTVLVTIGGCDPSNVTALALEALDLVEGAKPKVIVVVGGGAPFVDDVQKIAAQTDLQLEVHSNAMNMPELMARSDLVITGGGSTTWELAYMGLAGVVIPIVESQLKNAQWLDEIGIMINLGLHRDVSANLIGSKIGALMVDCSSRLRSAEIGQRLVDGNGGFRVIDHLVQRLEGSK